MKKNISVVIPVKNSEATIGECIEAVKRSDFNDFEIIVVDDNSTDNSIDIARSCGCKIVKSKGEGGVSAARNFGAEAADSDIILFIDADIILRENSLKIIEEGFLKTDTDAIVGVQSGDLRFRDFFSQFKNLWMRYTYTRLPSYVPLFYTSIASIKKEVFFKAGGFDINYKMPNVEDTEFGQRLSDMGFRVYLERRLEVEHVKKYDIVSILKTDFYRSDGLVKMVLRRGLGNFFNKNKTSVPSSFMMQLPFAIGFPVLLLLFFISEKISYGFTSLLFLALFLILNSDILFFLKKEKGIAFALSGMLFLFIDAYWIFAGMAYGTFTYYISTEKYY